MDYLREGIGLRAMAQRDPLVEYQREGAQMFDAMRDGFAEEVVGYLFNIDVQVVPDAAPEVTADSAAELAGNGLTIGARLTAGSAADTPDPGGKPAVIPPAAKRRAKSGRSAKRAAPAEPGKAAEEPTAHIGDSRNRLRVGGVQQRPDAKRLSYSAPDEQGQKSTTGARRRASEPDPYAGVGRNQPCPCGSGKKFKLCHGRNPNVG